MYSLKNWNEHCKHKDPSTFKDQDKQLQAQIITLNKEIRKLNVDLNTNSPDFSVFLKASCRHRTRSRHDTWHYYNFNLHLDGIHPGRNLARVWLREISDRIRADCWNWNRTLRFIGYWLGQSTWDSKLTILPVHVSEPTLDYHTDSTTEGLNILIYISGIHRTSTG